jgi:hypothetical protein
MQKLLIKVTVITADGERVQISLIGPSRRFADDLVNAVYPDHQAASMVIQRRASMQMNAGVSPC